MSRGRAITSGRSFATPLPVDILCTAGGCRDEVMRGAPLPACRKHLLRAAAFVLDSLQIEVNDVLSLPPTPRAESAYVHWDEVVYYVRRAHTVKIGTSTHVEQRMAKLGLPLSAVLAVEPGGRPLERMRHIEFQSTRLEGEWFLMTPKLQSHIDMLVEHHGPPLFGEKAARRSA